MVIRKIAILHTGFSRNDEDAAHRIAIAARRLDIAAEVFDDSVEIAPFAPDFVIALSQQDPKLTQFPTYGVVDTPFSQLDHVPRFVRNVLTYDACLTPSHLQKQWILDLSFGAHKQQPRVGFFMRTAQATKFATQISSDCMLASHIDENIIGSIKDVFIRLSRTRAFKGYGALEAVGGLDSQAYFGPVPADGTAMIDRFHAAGIGLALSSVERRQHDLPPEDLFQIIAAGAIAICARSPWVENAFGDNVLYVDADQGSIALASEILEQVAWVREHSEQAREKASAAHALLQQHYSAERLLMNVMELHDIVLVEKGYVPEPSETPDSLPSVSYIMRTGGGSSRPAALIRRALGSLVRQNYPKLTVIFVLHAAFPGLEEMMALEFGSLNYKIVAAVGSMRSTAIIKGIEAVEAGLFGLLDDDDEFHPNHVRMLVKTLRYHDRRDLRGPIGVAYASSVEVSAHGYRKERREWQDDYALDRKRRSCIEHYRWYTTPTMAAHEFFLMSNSWLAQRDLANEDVLSDPYLDTCEDLYVMIQLAQRSHLAFSCEVTAIHHFHGHGHSTVLDSGKHRADTERMARRAWKRTFPAQVVYYDPDHTVTGPPLGKNILPLMSFRGEGTLRDEYLHFDRSVEQGTAVWGPYQRFPTGRYLVTWFIEYRDLAHDAQDGLRFDIVYDSGNKFLGELRVNAESLRSGGRFQRLVMPFEIAKEAVGQEIEFRLWRDTEVTIDILRVAVTPNEKGAPVSDGASPGTTIKADSAQAPAPSMSSPEKQDLIGINLLPLLSFKDGGVVRGNILHLDRMLETGIIVWGPYVKVPAGSYRVTWVVELEGIDRPAGDGLRFEIAYDSGNQRVAEFAVPAKALRRTRKFQKIQEFSVPFDIPPELSQREIELRLWRGTEVPLNVLRVAIFPR